MPPKMDGKNHGSKTPIFQSMDVSKNRGGKIPNMDGEYFMEKPIETNGMIWWGVSHLPCDLGGAKEPGMMYFPTK